MRSLLLTFVAMFAFATLAAAQIPQQYIWKITFVADSEGTSNVTVQNRCQQTHDFQIIGSNVPFLDFAKEKVSVRGGGSENVPVLVNTKNLTRRSYQGQVTLFCLSCNKESTCGQSRDILNLTLNVVSKEELSNYRPSKEIGIDTPVAISSTASMNSSGSNGVSEAEVRKLLEELSGRPAVDNRPAGVAVSACGVPQMRMENSIPAADCKGNCAKRQKAVRELEAKVRRQTLMAEKYCLGLMQLENTTAFVEARARRAVRQLESANKTGSDERVLISLRSEAENSRKDAKVFKERLESARGIVDDAKEEAFAAMQELDDAVNDFKNCAQKSPSECK